MRKNIIIGAVITLGLLAFGHYSVQKEKDELEQKRIEAVNAFPPTPENARHLNFKTGEWVLGTIATSVPREKIQMPVNKETIRKNEEIEKFIEEHGQEIYERLEDKYGD